MTLCYAVIQKSSLFVMVSRSSILASVFELLFILFQEGTYAFNNL